MTLTVVVVASHGDTRSSLFTNYPRLAVLLNSQISTPGRLISVAYRDDSPAIPARRGRQPVALVDGVGSGA